MDCKRMGGGWLENCTRIGGKLHQGDWFMAEEMVGGWLGYGRRMAGRWHKMARG